LEGNGTEEQNSVVLANAAMALKTTGKFSGYEDCLFLAKESLESGKALQSFRNILK
jgi:anthranilate phosphoribosyltransferase